jgi:hypothetical protein
MRALVLLLALSLLASSAAAETAAGLLTEARRLYGLAEFESALEVLDRAKALARPGRELGEVLAQRAQALGELRGLGAAAAAFREALRQDDQICPRRGQGKGNLVQLCTDLRAAARGTLRLHGPGRGRSVNVDGTPGCVAPCELKLGLGAHRVEAGGLKPEVLWQGRLALDQSVTVEVPAEPVIAGPIAPQPPPRSARRRVWTWVAVGAAGALGLASLGCWLGSDSDYGAWSKEVNLAKPDEGHVSSLESSIHRKEVASWVLLGTAGAAAVTAAVLFFLEGKERPRRADSAAARGRRSAGLLQLEF